MKARIPGAPQNKKNMMELVQKMQEDMENVQKTVEETEFTSSSGGGAVEVVMDGKHQVRSIKISPEVVDPEDTEMLEDLLTAAINEAVRKADEAMEKGMESAKGGLSIPGLF
ncbi:MAG: YbaB/EbfC family nucleoid-associated protein [Clostridiales bacterium]|nr:YbaB/EbfC family nucleoid-associated protein [Clostridiales bacterium]